MLKIALKKGGSHERRKLRIALNQLVDGKPRGCDFLLKLTPAKDIGQLGQQRRAGEKFDALRTRGLQ